MEINLIADTICRNVELGLTISAISEQFTHIDCRPVERDPELSGMWPLRERVNAL